ncbi:glutathione S-transferase family protein [Pelagibius sp. 7325]|uniref:glutathione S-transferase family protein n=1 Tax=Pelagibius sp. 7325 TaxID=3131994 RepID=UPI0030EBABAF
MGLLIDGVWHDKWYDTKKSGGRFERQDSIFRNWVTPDGSAGPGGDAGFKAEAGRYHLYVSLACPWAHRTLIFRKLKKLEDLISLSVVHWHMGEEGWTFEQGRGVISDSVNGAEKLHQVYTAAKPDYTGRVTVPVLWDKQRETIVSNESAEIIRMFNSAFDGITGSTLDFYPKELRREIDAVNDTVYNNVNNGVYKAGFATKQEPYEKAFDALFATLDDLEERLSRQRYLAGPRLTEADWRLFTTLLRFDPVYHGHFKCNLRRLIDYPNLWAYARELYQVPGVAETVDFFHIKHHYYESHPTVNPSGIVPKGPAIDFSEPHGREALKAA